MKTKRGLFLIILIITIRAGFAQEAQEKIEYPNLVTNGDFEDGNVGFKSDFKSDTSCWGCYVITDNAAQYLGGEVFVNPVPNTGKYYFIDMNNSGKQRLWYDSITVKPNTTYSFSCILANVNAKLQAPGVMTLRINGRRVCPSMTLSNGSAAWTPFSIKFKTGPDQTRIEISIVDEIWTLMGNDVALDNIVFRQIPLEEFSSGCDVKFGQNLKIELFNKTGFDLDSVLIGDKYVGSIKKDASIIITDCNELTMQDGLPYGLPHGTVKGRKRDRRSLVFCGTGCKNVSTGQYKFDITLNETENGYTLSWHRHE